jgi:hypothetical protein
MADDIIIPEFKDIAQSNLQFPGLTTPNAPQQYRPGGLETIQIGTGFTVFNVDKQGLWMGNPRFANAPFRVSMSGKLFAEMIDENEQIISDGIGLHSVNNFAQFQTEQVIDQVITGNSWQVIVNLTMVTDNLPREALAVIWLNLSGFHDDTTDRLEFRVLVNSEQVGGFITLSRGAAAGAISSKSLTFPVLLSSGNNLIVVEGRSSNANSGTLKASIIPAVLGYLLLGK